MANRINRSRMDGTKLGWDKSLKSYVYKYR
jgi:hypothetical protein